MLKIGVLVVTLALATTSPVPKEETRPIDEARVTVFQNAAAKFLEYILNDVDYVTLSSRFVTDKVLEDVFTALFIPDGKANISVSNAKVMCKKENARVIPSSDHLEFIPPACSVTGHYRLVGEVLGHQVKAKGYFTVWAERSSLKFRYSLQETTTGALRLEQLQLETISGDKDQLFADGIIVKDITDAEFKTLLVQKANELGNHIGKLWIALFKGRIEDDINAIFGNHKLEEIVEKMEMRSRERAQNVADGL